MNKTTLELERDRNHIKGYGLFYEKTWTQHDILNKITKWSEGKNITIYNHILRIEEENIRENDLYIPFQNDPEGARQCGQTPIPRCDRVKYLDIYYQSNVK